jgi:hypothetical protein
MESPNQDSLNAITTLTRHLARFVFMYSNMRPLLTQGQRTEVGTLLVSLGKICRTGDDTLFNCYLEAICLGSDVTLNGCLEENPPTCSSKGKSNE